jgi:hypothetical protein
MFEINLNKLMTDLVSENYETQVDALEEVSDILSVLAEQCVKSLSVSDNPYLIAERLTYLGTRIIPPLERFVGCQDEMDFEKIFLGSIVLLRVGSKKGLDNVVKELKEKGQNEYLAANQLTKSKIPEAGDLIIERLRFFSFEEFKEMKTSTYISCLLGYLKELSTPLPNDLNEIIESLKSEEVYKYYVFD